MFWPLSLLFPKKKNITISETKLYPQYPVLDDSKIFHTSSYQNTLNKFPISESYPRTVEYYNTDLKQEDDDNLEDLLFINTILADDSSNGYSLGVFSEEPATESPYEFGGGDFGGGGASGDWSSDDSSD